MLGCTSDSHTSLQPSGQRSILPWPVSYLGSGYIAESEAGNESMTTGDVSRGILQYGAPALLAKRRYLIWPKALSPALALLY